MITTQLQICDGLIVRPVIDGRLLTYSREDLLSLRDSPPSNIKPEAALPPELRPRKRGKRGGIRSRIRRRPFKPPLPSIILANVRSLRNKMDMLRARCRLERAFRDICIIALTETWLDGSISDNEVTLGGFNIIRSDRTAQSGKMRGGGVCFYINDRWCTIIKIHQKICTPYADCVPTPPLSPPRIPHCCD